MLGYIYKTVNKNNGKIYIGQHRSEFFDLSYLGSGKLITDAIKKYGKNSFSVEILCKCDTQDEMDEREIEYISLYNSTDLRVGYNITSGGQKRFFTGMRHTDESKMKMRESALQREDREPTTLGRKYVNNGIINKCVPENEIPTYLSTGWEIGRISQKKDAWNRGLSSENNTSVYLYSKKRKDAYLNGEIIGCCGLSGDENRRRVSRRNYFDSLDKKEVYEYWYENGKSATQKKYGAYENSWEYLCEICKIVETPEHKFYIRSKAKSK